MNSYDGSVCYAAAAGLAHGLLPYRDFLFLHPPGIVVALVPFVSLGRVIGDPSGIEVATLAWFGIGALNAVLVSTILRPLGVVAALIGGLFYAIMVGAAAGTLISFAGSTGTRGMITALFMAGLALVAVPLLSASFGRSFPAAGPIAQRAAPLGGCVTVDDPRSLIQTDLLERNFQHGCTLVVDLGGYSYDIHPGTAESRSRNRRWQHFAIDYLRSGSAVIVMRFSRGSGLSAHSASVVQGWPVLLRTRHIVMRSPVRVKRGS
jgi:hypothetical protein